ncbi:hypothetical protein FIA58_008550 [Flavobacterium jejuense]|uniref:Arabinogalactan endo-beta-1,4-galactanase n=1 Tax=Flavobacterium jejuense TaxID=1544455 RepID=A0ABX0IPJ2_9FLAO|nr:hypothetical protein [Flavobacterium jejuense]NHN25727.1 hypothetical protein [Flavobacterium jejuense]
MSKCIYKSILILVVVSTIGCSNNESNSNELEQRTFFMGTTPWPADLTIEEVDKTYNFINEHCDIIAHHFDEGIPYEEAFNQTVMPQELLENINTRKTKTSSNTKVFLSVSALSITRVTKAKYYESATTTQTIKDNWEQLPFDDENVATAYFNYMCYLIDEFDPIYVNYGVESNGQFWNPIEFIKYKQFLGEVYTQLKVKYPNIPFFISFIVDESNIGFDYASQLIQYTDLIGISAYPYASISSSQSGNTNPDNFPADYFEKFIALDLNKSIAFAETAYIAQDLVIPYYNLNKQGNENWQKKYLEKVLNLCHSKRAKLFIWFCPKDYDALITTFQNQGQNDIETESLLKLWKDTGFMDESDNRRASYNSWVSWVSREKIE